MINLNASVFLDAQSRAGFVYPSRHARVARLLINVDSVYAQMAMLRWRMFVGRNVKITAI